MQDSGQDLGIGLQGLGLFPKILHPTPRDLCVKPNIGFPALSWSQTVEQYAFVNSFPNGACAGLVVSRVPGAFSINICTHAIHYMLQAVELALWSFDLLHA